MNRKGVPVSVMRPASIRAVIRAVRITPMVDSQVMTPNCLTIEEGSILSAVAKSRSPRIIPSPTDSLPCHR